MSTPFLVLALISVAVGIVSSIAVTAYVTGMRIPF
jgi:hypothetical protein